MKLRVEWKLSLKVFTFIFESNTSKTNNKISVQNQLCKFFFLYWYEYLVALIYGFSWMYFNACRDPVKKKNVTRVYTRYVIKTHGCSACVCLCSNLSFSRLILAYAKHLHWLLALWSSLQVFFLIVRRACALAIKKAMHHNIAFYLPPELRDFLLHSVHSLLI